MTRVLHHERLAPDGSEPDKWLLMLHGIFGSGRNWSQVARRVIERRPDWGVVLMDLPEHGRSSGVKVEPTLEGAAEAVLRTVEAESIPAAGILGHSFGGKVALCYAEAADGLAQTWIADASPAPAEPAGHGWSMLQKLRDLPGPFESRDDAVAALVAAGVSEPVAKWVAMNLVRRRGNGLAWRFDLDRVEQLLRDFYAADLWDVIECDTNGLRIDFIKADASGVLTDDALHRISRSAEANSRLHLHHVPGGHWINIDSADAVVDLLADRLVV